MSADEDLSNEIAEKVWRGLSGNGSLRINIDTDVDCYGPWEPDYYSLDVPGAQSWLRHLVHMTIKHLNEHPQVDLKWQPK